MTATKTEIRRGTYYDSVVLMQLQVSLANLPGVVGVGVDALTGDNKEYESHVHVDLIPSSRPAPPPIIRD